MNKILIAGNYNEKESFVTVDKPVNEQFIQKMSIGLPI
jgi:23S rRNA pseudouridine2604 synthase